jgi:TP901 family phage tail tape measure protein
LADRSISIALEARVQGFVSGMRTAQQATTDFADRTASFARENEQHLDRVGKASMVMGGALLAGVAIAVKSFMEFDSAMSEVQASTHETTGNMELLREAAVNAGADTAFSAKEAAQGIDELAKAGVSTKDILGGGLTGALSLAAAGSLDVAKAAEISASALTQFKLSGEKVPHLADLLAAGAGKAQGSVEDLGAALNQTGLVAASTGLSIEETTGGLAAFASAGLTGSDAGTSMKTMLQRLTPQSLEAKNMMSDLGISAYDAQGQFIGLAKFSENLKTSMKDLTPEARNAAMGVIFGSDAVRAANVLYEQGAKGISDWTDKVNDAGYAAVTASIKQDNLAGDLEKLGGSFDSVLIKGGSGAAEALRGIVQGAEDLVDAVGKIPGPVLTAGTGIAGVAGAGLLVSGMLVSALPKLMEFKGSFDALSEKSPKAAAGIKNVGKAAGIATVALVALQVAGAVFTDKNTKSTEDFGQALLKVGKAADGSGLDSVFQGWDKLAFGETVAGVDSMSDAVRRLTHQDGNDWLNQNLADPANRLLGFSESDVTQVENRLKGLGGEMGNLVKNGGAETAAKAFQQLTTEFQRNGKGAKEALESMPGYKDALQELATKSGVVLSEQDLLDLALGRIPTSMQGAAAGTDTFKQALEDSSVELGGVITDMDKFLEQLFATGLITMSARDANAAYNESLRNVPKVLEEIAKSQGKMGRTLNDNATDFDLTTEAGAKANAALQDIAQKGMAEVTAQAKEGLGQEDLQKTLSTSYDDIVANADAMGIHGKAAEDLARKILGVPPNVDVKTWIEQTAAAQADALKKQLDDLNGRRISIMIDTYKTSFEKRVGLPSTLADGSYGQGAGVYAIPPGTPSNPLNKATGGRVFGPGTDTSDSVPHMLSKDEYVLKASAARAIGYGNLDRMNAQMAPASAPARQAAPVAAGASPGLTLNFGDLTALDPVQLRRDITADVTHIINTKGGVRLA